MTELLSKNAWQRRKNWPENGMPPEHATRGIYELVSQKKGMIKMYTTVSDYAQRFSVWTKSIASEKLHVETGCNMQEQGEEILKNIAKNIKNFEAATKLIQQANNTIEKGIKVEREARKELASLLQHEPREL